MNRVQEASPKCHETLPTQPEVTENADVQVNMLAALEGEEVIIASHGMAAHHTQPLPDAACGHQDAPNRRKTPKIAVFAWKAARQRRSIVRVPVQKKLSVILPATLHLDVKRYCLENDLTITELITRLLRAFLSNQLPLPPPPTSHHS